MRQCRRSDGRFKKCRKGDRRSNVRRPSRRGRRSLAVAGKLCRNQRNGHFKRCR